MLRVAAHYSALKHLGSEYRGGCPVCLAPAGFFVRPEKDRCGCVTCSLDSLELLDAIGLIRVVEGVDERIARKRLWSRAWKPKAPIVQAGGRPAAKRKKPPRKSIRQRCGAYARSTGKPCVAHVARRPDGTLGKRCRNHGGLATGPRTPDGKARSTLNLRRTPSWRKKARG